MATISSFRRWSFICYKLSLGESGSILLCVCWLFCFDMPFDYSARTSSRSSFMTSGSLYGLSRPICISWYFAVLSLSEDSWIIYRSLPWFASICCYYSLINLRYYSKIWRSYSVSKYFWGMLLNPSMPYSFLNLEIRSFSQEAYLCKLYVVFRYGRSLLSLFYNYEFDFPPSVIGFGLIIDGIEL